MKNSYVVRVWWWWWLERCEILQNSQENKGLNFEWKKSRFLSTLSRCHRHTHTHTHDNYNDYDDVNGNCHCFCYIKKIHIAPSKYHHIAADDERSTRTVVAVVVVVVDDFGWPLPFVSSLSNDDDNVDDFNRLIFIDFDVVSFVVVVAVDDLFRCCLWF